MNYKPGDKVTVRSDLEHAKWYGDDTLVNDMKPWRGQEVTIAEVDRDTNGKCFAIQEDNGEWNWTEDMFEKEYEK